MNEKLECNLLGLKYYFCFFFLIADDRYVLNKFHTQYNLLPFCQEILTLRRIVRIIYLETSSILYS